ncbi:MAG TPA: DUF2167 domain-containing protein [Rhodocyclaceae bacterium]|nr:DUF2167 domain-containing protein [Rhodocyclaceae bacterium]
MLSHLMRLGAILGLLAAAPCSMAQDAPQAAPNEMATAISEAKAAIIVGPSQVAVAGQAKLNLPEGYGFIPAAQSIKLLRAMGNRPGDEVNGLIVPTANDTSWFMVVRYIAAGYIKDDDARDWKADALLKDIREGTEETNAERRSRGIPEMEIIGWVEPPHYESANHRLVWSISSKNKGAPANDDNGVNYNTLALGREGYISMNLVADLQQIETLKPVARTLLGSLDFNEGKRYADFNSSTDKVAEYGLAALIGGVAAKKLGMFALIAAFFAKFAKVIGVAAIAGGAALTRFFGRKKAAAANDQA